MVHICMNGFTKQQEVSYVRGQTECTLHFNIYGMLASNRPLFTGSACDLHLNLQRVIEEFELKNKSIFINLRYLRLKKICHIFHHNFKNIPCYVMSEVSLKRFYFALFDDGLTLKTLKMAFIGFLIKTLQLHLFDVRSVNSFHIYDYFWIFYNFGKYDLTTRLHSNPDRICHSVSIWPY